MKGFAMKYSTWLSENTVFNSEDQKKECFCVKIINIIFLDVIKVPSAAFKKMNVIFEHGVIEMHMGKS